MMSSDSHPDSEDSVSSEAPTGSESHTHSVDCGVCSFEEFEYLPDEGVYRAIFDADGVAPSMAVIGAISTVADKDPLNIEPLYSTIDPEALDTLFAHSSRSEGDKHARFSVEGYSVLLSSYGCITVRQSQSDRSQIPVDGGDYRSH
jgi:hypothetical protein